jgi:hypothetical protein
MEKWHVRGIGGSLLVLFGAGADVSHGLNPPQCNPSTYWCAPIDPRPGHTLPASAVVAATITSTGASGTYSSAASYIVHENTGGGSPVNIPVWAHGSRWPDYPVWQEAVDIPTPPA